jgi:sugar lactone lactonase YvrE
MRMMQVEQLMGKSCRNGLAGMAMAIFLLAMAGTTLAQVPSVTFTQANGVTGLGSTPTKIDYSGTAGHMAANARGDLFIPVSSNNMDFLEEIPANGGAAVSLLGPSSGAANSTGNAQGVTVDSNGNLYATYSDQGPTYHAAIVYIPFVNGTYATGTQFGNLSACSAFPVPATTATPCTVPYGNYLPTATGGYVQPADVALDGAGDLFILTKYIGGTINGGTIAVIKIPAANPSNSAILNVGQLNNGGGSEIAVDKAGDVFATDGYGNNYYLAAGASSSISLGGLYYITGVSIDNGGNVYFTQANGANGSSIIILPSVDGNACNGSGCTADAYTLTTQLGTGYTSNPNLGVGITGYGKIYYAGSYPNSISSVTVGNLSFGAEAVGTTSSASTMNMTGGSSAPTFGQFKIAGPFAVSATTCANATTYGPYATKNCSVSITYTATSAGPQTGTLQAFDVYGNLLGTVTLSGSGTAATVNVDPGTVSPVGSGWTAPSAIAIDNLGNTYVADTNTGKIYKNDSTNPVATGFVHPTALAVDSAGDLFVGDSGAASLFEVPYNLANGSYNANITLLTGLSGTIGLAVDSSGNLYVADSGHSRVLLLSSSGGLPVGSLAATLGSGFMTPVALSIDGNGNLYISDSGLGQVIQYNIPNGTQATILSGLTTAAGIATDATGGLFAADSGAATIVHVPSIGGVLNKNLQVAIATIVPTPSALAVDSSGNVYVADTPDAMVGMMNRNSGVLQFGNIEALDSSASTAATVSNGGTLPLTFGSPDFTATGDTSGTFSLQTTSTCAASGTLAPGAACTVAAVFTPPSTGVYNETLAFAATPATTSTLLLTGTGVQLPKTTTTISSVAPATPTFGQQVTVTATVTPVSAGATPAGTVTFSVDGTPVVPATALNGSGTASITLSSLTGGAHTITASYNGSTVYAASASAVYNLAIGKSSTTTSATIQSSTVYTNPTAQSPGVTVTFIAAVVPGQPGTPTGVVTFYSGSTAIGSAPVTPGGTATLNISTLALGQYNVYASYGGDSNYTSSASSPTLSLLISNPTAQITSSASTLTGGGPPVTLTLTSVAGFGTASGTTGAVDLACTGLPAYSTCSFSPSVGLTFPGTPGQVQLKVVVNQPPVITVPAGIASLPKLGGLRGVLLAALLLSPAALLLRRRRTLFSRGLLCLLLFTGCATLFSGCGSGTTSSTTPKGTTTIQVTATIGALSGSTTPVVAQSLPLQLVVQ